MLNIGGEKIATRLPNSWIVTSGRPNSKSIFLTFDDGPNDKFTIPICDLLEKFDAKATFFCVGKSIDQNPEIAKYVIEKGHFIANHSQNHLSFKTLTLREQLAEAGDCQVRINSINSELPKIFRAPQGQLNPALFITLKSRGWKIVHWSFDSRDYLQKPLDQQLEVFRDREIRNGDVLLFHDDHQIAIDILEVLLPEWQLQGFTFPTIAELVR